MRWSQSRQHSESIISDEAHFPGSARSAFQRLRRWRKGARGSRREPVLHCIVNPLGEHSNYNNNLETVVAGGLIAKQGDDRHDVARISGRLHRRAAFPHLRPGPEREKYKKRRKGGEGISRKGCGTAGLDGRFHFMVRPRLTTHTPYNMLTRVGWQLKSSASGQAENAKRWHRAKHRLAPHRFPPMHQPKKEEER